MEVTCPGDHPLRLRISNSLTLDSLFLSPGVHIQPISRVSNRMLFVDHLEFREMNILNIFTYPQKSCVAYLSYNMRTSCRTIRIRAVLALLTDKTFDLENLTIPTDSSVCEFSRLYSSFTK